MVILVMGGSGSGKSAYAERLLEEMSEVKNKYYLATMQVLDEDGKNKVERHKKMRQGKGFFTVEQPKDVEQAAGKLGQGENAVLLECMSNLTANEMFGDNIHSIEEVTAKVLRGIRRLKNEVKHLVIVTNNVFEEGVLYGEGTVEYVQALAQINRELAKEADEVTEVVAGLPVILKQGGREG